MNPERITLRDFSLHTYRKALESIQSGGPFRTLSDSLARSDEELDWDELDYASGFAAIGWAMKKGRITKHFTQQQLTFLREQFDAGLREGKKDPSMVAAQMKVITKHGERVFSPEDVLSANQIKSWFSREKARRSSAATSALQMEVEPPTSEQPPCDVHEEQPEQYIWKK